MHLSWAWFNLIKFLLGTENVQFNGIRITIVLSETVLFEKEGLISRATPPPDMTWKNCSEPGSSKRGMMTSIWEWQHFLSASCCDARTDSQDTKRAWNCNTGWICHIGRIVLFRYDEEEVYINNIGLDNNCFDYVHCLNYFNWLLLLSDHLLIFSWIVFL